MSEEFFLKQQVRSDKQAGERSEQSRKGGKIDAKVATQRKQEKTCKEEAAQKGMHKLCNSGEEQITVQFTPVQI